MNMLPNKTLCYEHSKFLLLDKDMNTSRIHTGDIL